MESLVQLRDHDTEMHPDDKPCIGIILCKGKNKVVAEYSLRDTNKPIGVSSYQLTEGLPESLKGNLPSIEAGVRARNDRD
jgi:hypothetical protein